MEIDGIRNDDRERVGNTVTQKEQSCVTETGERRQGRRKVTQTVYVRQVGDEAGAAENDR